MFKKEVFLGAAIWFMASASCAGPAGFDQAMKVPPEQAAISAAEQKDFRYMSAPTCFDGLPGYTGPGFPEPWPPKLAWKSCEDIVGPEMASAMRKLNEYAKAYNSKMGRLRVERGIDK